MTALLIDNPKSLQEWKETVCHFSSYRKKIDKLNDHLFKIIKKQKRASKTTFSVLFIPIPSVFEKERSSFSNIPASYLIDAIQELIELATGDRFSLNFISSVNYCFPITPFQEDPFTIAINQQEDVEEIGRKDFSVEIKKGKTVYFESYLSISQ